MNNLTVINPMGVAVEIYTLDAQERVESVTNLEGQRLDVTYLVGDLVSSVDRFDGVLVSNVYDTSGNVIKTLHDGASIEQTAYRKNGQLSSLSNAVAQFDWNYDVRGIATNVQRSVNGDQTSVDYAFDPVGNVTGVLYNVGCGTLDVAYTYDEAERLAAQANIAGEFTYSYNPYNGAVGTLSNDAIKVDYAYDILNAVTNTVYEDGSNNPVASFDYKHDVLGLITQKITVVDGAATTNSYVFDNLGRLTSEQVNTDAAVSYTYDLAGNRLTSGGSNYTYTHNKLDGDLHDAAGNITNMVQDGVTLDLTWNTQGQLTAVNTNGVFAESYTWDPLGNRLSTTDASGTTYHAYDGSQCIADYTATGDLIATYTWGTGVDNLLAVNVCEETSTNTYYAVKDHLNSVHALIDESGNTVMSVAYNAWGTPLNSSLSIQNSSFRLRYLWQGREYSYATGLYNFRARWYDSTIGRWLSKDPIGLEGGLNLYVFCGNDPVNYRDPWGECRKHNPDVEFEPGIQDMSGVYIAELAGAVLKWGRLAGWLGSKLDDLARGFSRYADDFARGLGKSCFVAGTLVATDNGDKPIENIQTGDRVWSYDLRAEKWSLREVETPLRHEYHGDLITVTIEGNQIIEATGNHPFWVVDGEAFMRRPIAVDVPAVERGLMKKGRWVEARDLHVGDTLLLRVNHSATVTSVAVTQAATAVYNLAVADFHNYAVSKYGVLVHNKAMHRKPGKLGQFKGRDALRAENRVARDAAKAANLNKDQQRMLHDTISGEGFSYQEVLEAANNIKKGSF